MLIDLVVVGREALIVGGGQESELKALKLLDGGAKITVLSGSFTSGLKRLASKNSSLKLVQAKASTTNLRKVVSEAEPRVIFISTGDSRLDEELAVSARISSTRGALVCVVDDPRLNDFNMPAIAKLGDIRVGVSTGGKSPAMAGIIRRKIEKAIGPEEILQVKLQGHIRKASKVRLKDPAARKDFAYRVIGNRQIAALLKKKRYAAARKLAEKMLEEVAGNA